MKDNTDLDNNRPLQPTDCGNTELVQLADGILLDTKASMLNKPVISVPIAQLSTLGAAAASLLPAFRTVTQTTTLRLDGLYRLANANIGDTLKVADNGNFWAALKEATGKSKLAQLQEAGPVSVSTSTVAAIDPAMLMMAAALFSIEQQLGDIVEMEHQILAFLETEKEAEIEADLETLTSLLTKYKFSWDNEHFITSNHKLVLDIQRTARKNMNSYQKNMSDVLKKRTIFRSQSKVNATLDDLLNKFQYYRLSLYVFSMASFTEIMLSGEFKEENILTAKKEIEKRAETYRDLFTTCSFYLEKLSNTSIENNLRTGLGTASKAVGKVIESIPVIREGPVDEFLQDNGTQMKRTAVLSEQKVVRAFAELGNPGVRVFTEKMDDMIQIYGHTREIYFDNSQIYLVG